MRVAPKIILTSKERLKLESLRDSRKTAHRLIERSAIVLLAADGLENKDISRSLGLDLGKVGRWRSRYSKLALAGIQQDATRPGRIKAIAAGKVSEVLRLTQHSRPEGGTHWSRATMAKAAGISESSVGRIWAAHGLKPHRIKTFKVSNDKRFEEKLRDIVGLYQSPPEHALVFSCDEKSQIQALDRTQPGLPMKKGRCGTMTHDYKRNGTTTLFAAMNTLDGTVIGRCMSKHRHQEWLAFLRQLDRETPAQRPLHVICDNYATHKHAKVQAWQRRNPRFTFHFTPTSASWLNMVERFFRDLTVNSVRRGVFHDVGELIEAIEEHLRVHNLNPKPFIWTASANDILQKVSSARRALNKMQSD
jgi:transposase